MTTIRRSGTQLLDLPYGNDHTSEFVVAMSYGRAATRLTVVEKSMNTNCIRPKALPKLSRSLVLGGLIALLVAARAADASPINVAFVLTAGANVIDMTGPWEVFQDTMAGDQSAFQLFTVGESTSPVTMSGGLRAVPNYTFENAPHADIVVIGAQQGEGAPVLLEWLRARARDSRVVMSVCTGAYKLARVGLLDGKKATTHHEFWDEFARTFPKVQLVRGSRFVQSDDVIYTAGGLTSGIDLALHIVEKFYGPDTADQTAAHMEYHRRDRD
jgi:transcriptional regulator GlxA family with amidase domain